MIKQRTVAGTVSALGTGLHSGAGVRVTLRPAPADTGIIYTRTDLTPPISIKTSPTSVRDTQLCTALVTDGGVRVATVEHLTAALAAFGIDNLYVDADAPELPVMDGSAAPFVYLLQSVGVKILDAPKTYLRVRRRVRVEEAEKWAELRPTAGGFSLDLTLDFDHPAMPRDGQRLKLEFSGRGFVDELSRARTFCFMKDVEYMHAHHLALGGSLENAVVLDEYRVINPDGLRYPNEFVRHKMLDAVGDLYMHGRSILGAFCAYKTGHTLNNRLLRVFLSDPDNYEHVVLRDDEQIHPAFGFLESRAPAPARL